MNDPTSAPEILARKVRQILDVPLHRHLGLAFDGHADGQSHAHFDVGPQAEAFGGLHGGILYLLMDATAMLALLPSLTASQHAVTHDIHCSVMRPVSPGARVRLVGSVLRVGRTLAFVEATAMVDGKPVASARVTKSLTASGH